jgi:hypothetical protein
MTCSGVRCSGVQVFRIRRHGIGIGREIGQRVGGEEGLNVGRERRVDTQEVVGGGGRLGAVVVLSV